MNWKNKKGLKININNIKHNIISRNSKEISHLLDKYIKLRIGDKIKISQKELLDLFNIIRAETSLIYKKQIKTDFEKRLISLVNYKCLSKIDIWLEIRKYFQNIITFDLYNQIKYFKKTKNVELFFNHLVWLKNKELIDIRLLSNKSNNEIKDKYNYDYLLNMDPFNVLKKIYSSNPYYSYYNFDKLRFIDQISSLYEEKTTDILYSDNVRWWSCHNWSIIYSNFLEKLGIKSRFVIFGVHSFLIFPYKWKWYNFDTNHNVKFYPQILEIWKKIDIWDGQFWIVEQIYPKFIVKVNNLESKQSDKLFIKKERFINYLDNRKKTYILVEYTSFEKDKKNINKLEICISNWKLKIEFTNWVIKKLIKFKNYKIRNYIIKNKNKWIVFTTRSILFKIFDKTWFSKLKSNKVILGMLKVINPSVLEEIILNNIDTTQNP
jgi:hypothetical protein